LHSSTGHCPGRREKDPAPGESKAKRGPRGRALELQSGRPALALQVCVALRAAFLVPSAGVGGNKTHATGRDLRRGQRDVGHRGGGSGLSARARSARSPAHLPQKPRPVGRTSRRAAPPGRCAGRKARGRCAVGAPGGSRRSGPRGGMPPLSPAFVSVPCARSVGARRRTATRCAGAEPRCTWAGAYRPRRGGSSPVMATMA